MRAPFQVLVMPFRVTDGSLEFCLLRREDKGVWQGVAGGGEVGEDPLDAALRELSEELPTCGEIHVYRLDSVCSVPASEFAASSEWPEHVIVIPEWAFCVDVSRAEISGLSDEHTKLYWAPEDVACAIVQYDSNRTAMMEVSVRWRRRMLGDCIVFPARHD